MGGDDGPVHASGFEARVVRTKVPRGVLLLLLMIPFSVVLFACSRLKVCFVQGRNHNQFDHVWTARGLGGWIAQSAGRIFVDLVAPETLLAIAGRLMTRSGRWQDPL